MLVEVNRPATLKTLLNEVNTRARAWTSCAVSERPDYQEHHFLREDADSNTRYEHSCAIETQLVHRKDKHEPNGLYSLGLKFADDAYKLLLLYGQIQSLAVEQEE